DVASMLRLAGLPHFFTEASFQQEKEDLAAYRRAKKLDDDGEGALAESLAAVKRLQKYAADNFIRRTSKSRDWKGKVLIDLPDYVEIVGVLKLTSKEREALQSRNEYITEMCVRRVPYCESLISLNSRLNTGDSSAYKIMTRVSDPIHAVGTCYISFYRSFTWSTDSSLDILKLTPTVHIRSSTR
ncbi:hypothetical protein C0993_003896, partial [Termitomyces sp. T159_Od127]